MCGIQLSGVNSISRKQVSFRQEIESVIGKDIGTSDWITIDQERINKFADATMDNQFIHCLLYTSDAADE